MAEQTLERELAAFQSLLPSLLTEEGKFALVFSEKLVGVFDSYQAALAKGYEVAQLKPFLVKKISGAETIAYFSRDVRNNCPILPS